MGYGAPGVKTFLGLEDTPASYTGKPLKVARVKSALDGLEFADAVTQYEIPTSIIPDEITQECHLTTMKAAKTILISGRIMYVCSPTATNGTVYIYDITDIENPTELYKIESGYGYYSDIALSGKYLFIVSSAGEDFLIYDVSNPANPVAVFTNPNAGEVIRIIVRGRYAYILRYGDTRLDIYDVANPDNPVLVGNYTSAEYMLDCYDMCLQGNYLFVRNNKMIATTWNLTSINIADPTNPVRVSSMVLPSQAEKGYMAQVGKYLYVCDGSADTLRIIDVSDPASMTQVGSLASSAYLNWCHHIVVIGDWAIISAKLGHMITIVDVSDPTEPTHHKSYTIEAGASPGAIAIAGKYLFISKDTSELDFWIYSLWSIDIPAFIGNCIFADYICTNNLDVAELMTAKDASIDGRPMDALPNIISIPLILTNVVASAPGTAYIEVSALYRTNLDLMKLPAKQARVIVSAIGNEAGAGKGIQIWNSTDSAEICAVTWDGDTQQNALAGSWADVTIRGAKDIQVRVKGASGTENITIDKVELQLTFI